MIVMSLGLGNLAVTMLGLAFTGQMAKLTKIPYPVLGFLIIPISLLAAYQDTVDISAISIVLGGAILGLLMKRYKWPRPPLLIAFILGPIIENNIDNSVGRYGWDGTFTRPLFIILFVLAIATGVIFTRFMNTSQLSGAVAQVAGGDAPPPSGGAQDAMKPSKLTGWFRGKRWHFTEAQLFSGGMVILMIYAIYLATGYSFFGRWFPIGSATLGLVLALITFVREGYGGKTGEIMDIGIRSAGMQGAREAGIIFVSMLGLMLVLAGIIGLQWSAIVIAGIGPMIMMRNKIGYIGGLISGLLIMALNFFFFGGIFGSDGLLAVLWPGPFILDWFK